MTTWLLVKCKKGLWDRESLIKILGSFEGVDVCDIRPEGFTKDEFETDIRMVIDEADMERMNS